MTKLLRLALSADAAISGATGLLMLFGAGFLAGFLNLPKALLVEAGILLIPFVIALAVLATRRSIRPAFIYAVIGLNVLWVIGSVLLLLGGWIAPNALGIAFIVVQAVAVFGFAELQYIALRRALREPEDRPAGATAAVR
jgi:hypothetical protein